LTLEKHFVVLNIGSGQGIRLSDLAKKINLIIQGSLNGFVTFGEDDNKEFNQKVADITYVRKLLHWEPKVKIEEGIKKILESEETECKD